MSVKLNPLSSALVVALPFVLTACGDSSSGGAAVPNANTGNTVSNANATKIQTQSNQEVKQTTSLNVEENKSTTTQTATTGGFKPIVNNSSNQSSSITIAPTTGTGTTTTTNVINDISSGYASSGRASNTTVDVSNFPLEKKPSTSTSASTTTSTVVKDSQSTLIKDPTVDSHPASVPNITTEDSNLTLPTVPSGSSDKNTSNTQTSTDNKKLGNISPATDSYPPVINETTDKIITSNQPIAKPVEVEGLYSSLVQKDARLVSGETRGEYIDNQKIFISTFNLTSLNISQGINQQIRDNYKKNPEIFYSPNSRTPKESRVSNNRNLYLFENFNPVFSGEVYTSLGITDAAVNNFNGNGVKVAIIDGIVDPSNEYFNTQPERIWYKDDLVVTNNDVIESNSKSNHGTNVGLIIAGKASATSYGITPNARLGYIMMPKTPNFDKMYAASYSYGAAVVNNSYVFNNISSTYLKYDTIYNTLEEITSHADAPLYVFVTGNQPTKLNDQGHYVLDESRFYTGPAEFLNRLTNEPKLRSNLMVVGGADISIDPDSQAYKEYVAKLEVYNNLTPAQKTATPKPVLTASSQYIKRPLDIVPCGDSMFNCMVAINYYYLPSANNSTEQERSYGVSFSAPQITATAALLKQAYPWMTASNLKTTLLTTATDVGEIGVDKDFGWGILNATRALRGPTQFAFGDFYANLGTSTGNYYFANNIYGDGGLIVAADVKNRNGTLILTGKNTYKGDTSVNSGTLALKGSSISSRLVINRDGTVFLKNSTTGDVINNGVLYILDGSTVKGNFTQTKNATVSLQADNPAVISGTATLNGTVHIDNYNSYVSAQRKVRPILRATRLTDGSAFTNKVSLGQITYDLYYDYTAGTVLADIYRKNVSNTTTVLSSSELTSAQDKELLNMGGSVLESFLTKVDQQLTRPVVTIPTTEISSSSSSHKSIVTLASNKARTLADTTDVEISDARETNATTLAVNYVVDRVGLSVDGTSAATPEDSYDFNGTTVTLAEATNTNVATDSSNGSLSTETLTLARDTEIADDATLKQYAYQASGSALANSLQAQASTYRLNSKNFTDSVVSDFNQLNDSLRTYFDVQGNNVKWNNSSTNLTGRYNQTSTTIGVMTDTHNLRVGAGITIGSGSWTDAYKGTEHATLDTKAYGLHLILAQQLNNMFVAGKLGASSYSLSGKRFVVSNTNSVTSKFHANELNAGFLVGTNYKLTQDLSVQFKAGLDIARITLNAFGEKGDNATAQNFAFSFQHQNITSPNLNLGSELTYSFSFLDLSHRLRIGFDWDHAFNAENFQLKTNEQATPNSPLSIKDVLTVSAGYGVKFSPSLAVDLMAKYQKSSSWKDRNLNLALTYTF